METPPLTRGRPLDNGITGDNAGNTPAYAGKTARQRNHGRQRRKHPRLRGEDSSSAPLVGNATETPPLTRGRPKQVARDRLHNGNTPAYAGKTTISFVVILMRRKHPRLRGEDLYARHDLEAEFRNTPAYAGKTTATWCPSDTTRETPPLTRGRLFPSRVQVSRDGNTPAYAGKTPASLTDTRN